MGNFKQFNNKNTLKMKAILFGLLHLAPLVGIFMIAINHEPIYHAIGTAMLCMSALVLGYIHGINKSFG
jgi:hypothetical protein